MRSRLLMIGAVGLSTAIASGQFVFEDMSVVAGTPQSSGLFGHACAMDGGVLVASAPNAQQVYLYDAATGTSLHQLVPADVNGSLDGPVAISGNVAIAGAALDDEMGRNAGAVYLFDVTTGAQIAKVFAPDANAGDYFGYSVAIDGNTFAVGANLAGSGPAGKVYLFDVATQSLLHEIEPADLEFLDGFGTVIAMRDGALAVSTDGYLPPPAGNMRVESVYLFDVATGDQLHKISSPDPDRHDFGRSLAIDDGVLVIGNDEYDTLHAGPGTVTLYDIASGAELYTITPNELGNEADFGSSVALDGGVLVVGVPASDLLGTSSGAAYVYDASTGARLAELVPSDGGGFDFFGRSGAIEGGRIAVGATGVPNGGAVYLFALGPCPGADLAAPFGVLDFSDVSAFLTAFATMSQDADLAAPVGVFDFSDVTTFLSAFGAGCP